jgi:hypothetical protein
MMKSASAPFFFSAFANSFGKSNALRNVPPSVHQKIARQTNNPLIRAATSRRRQFGEGIVRDVYADYGEITSVELPNIRTTPTSDRLSSILVRIGP